MMKIERKPRAVGTLVMSAWAVASLPAPARADDWPQSGKDMDGHANTTEALGTKLSPAWTLTVKDAGPRGPLLGAPVVADGTVVIGRCGGALEGVRALTGTRLWTRSLPGGIAGGAALGPGVAFAASSEGVLVALRARDGQELWRRRLNGQVNGAPVLSADDLLLGTGFPYSGLSLVSARSGALRWETLPGVFPDLLNGTATAASGHVVAVDRGGRVHQIDGATGLERVAAEAGGETHGTRPLARDGVLYVLTGGVAAGLTVIDLATGGVTARVPITDPVAAPAGATAARRFAVSSLALVDDAAAGRLVFQVRFEYEIGSGGAPGGARVHQLREWLFAFDLGAGRATALAPLGDALVKNQNALPQLGVCSTPAVFAVGDGTRGVAAASSLEPVLRVIGPLDGTVLWQGAMVGTSRAPVAVANAHLFVASDAGVLQAFASEENVAPLAPAAVTAGGGGDRVDAARPRVAWRAAVDRDGQPVRYRVRLDDDDEIERDWLVEMETGAGVTTAALPGPLVAGHRYTVAVRARDSRGAWSEWSSPVRLLADESPGAAIGPTRFPSLAEALAAARGGDVVTLGPGTLVLGSPLILPAGVSLSGRSAGQTRLQSNGGGAVIQVSSPEGGAAAARTIIEGVEISGGETGVEISGTAAVTLRNVVVCDNRGQGVVVKDAAQAAIVNATVVRNGVGAVAVGGALAVRNSIFTENDVGLQSRPPGTVASRYNDLFANAKSAYDAVKAGAGDLATPVLFASSSARDFSLATAQPSTDRGDPADDYSKERAPNGGRINLGAFGGTVEAETSAPSATSAESGGCAMAGLARGAATDPVGACFLPLLLAALVSLVSTRQAPPQKKTRAAARAVRP